VFGPSARNPNFVPAHAYRAILLIELGRVEEAREAWNAAGHLSQRALMPDIRERLPYKRPADLERFLAGVQRASTR
jgi:predicted RNA polymerase sigma factor